MPFYDENFGSAQSVNQSKEPKMSFPISATRGYFVFPPRINQPSVSETPCEETPLPTPLDRDSEAEWEARKARDEAAHQQRIRLEREAAAAGEREWVRAGGLLRDPRGRVDWARTEAVRAEIRLLGEETRLKEMWETYERRWRTLLAGYEDVRWEDLPWPVDLEEQDAEHASSSQAASVTPGDLTAPRVRAFLLAPLSIRGATVTRKERLRAGMLRWHPDKLGHVMTRVIATDFDAVKEGIALVFNACLEGLHELESANINGKPLSRD